MHQTKKATNGVGMKANIGVDVYSGAVHTRETTPANTADINKGHSLFMGPGKRKALGKKGGDQITRVPERLKSSVRACKEHPFHYIKNIFGLKKSGTKAWPRIPHCCTPYLRWPIC